MGVPKAGLLTVDALMTVALHCSPRYVLFDQSSHITGTLVAVPIVAVYGSTYTLPTVAWSPTPVSVMVVSAEATLPKSETASAETAKPSKPRRSICSPFVKDFIVQFVLSAGL